MTDAIVLSPHLDDAVLSASNRLTCTGTTVVTVFSGLPPDEITLTDWDRVTRASSSRERQRERLAEDDEAMSLFECASLRLDEPEEQYRTGQLDRERLAERLAGVIGPAAEVWAPAAIGGHPDHLAARDAALAAVAAVPERPQVYLYADIPYSLWYGWPAWVTGQEAVEYLDTGAWLDSELRRQGLDPDRMVPHVVELTPQARARKEKAVRAYRSQLPGLSLDGTHPSLWRNAHSHEVAWRLLP